MRWPEYLKFKLAKPLDAKRGQVGMHDVCTNKGGNYGTTHICVEYGKKSVPECSRTCKRKNYNKVVASTAEKHCVCEDWVYSNLIYIQKIQKHT